jgi:hypothetical protein
MRSLAIKFVTMKWLVSTVLLVLSVDVAAHRFAQSSLDVRALGDGKVSAVWKTPAQATSPIPMLPILPTGCVIESATPWFPEGTGKVQRQEWNCEFEWLEGVELGVSGLSENQSSAVISVRPRPEVFFQTVVTAEEPTYLVPSQRSLVSTGAHYLWLGAEHIAVGVDHLFFVTGLLLLVGWGKRLIYTVTAFTAGHSITLALVSLGIVTNPEALIEWLIAVSIWVLAVELGREQGASRLWQKPWYLAGAFGLLHGMGFAGALAETGLPQLHLPTALLFFNVGIELGQIAFILVLVFVGALIRRLLGEHLWLQTAPVYILGAVSTFWVLDRTGGLFG